MYAQIGSRSSRADLREIKAQHDLRLIAEQILGPPLRRGSRYHQYRAPQRRDRSPSLTVWADGFKDFGAEDKAGDLFTFLAIYAGMQFRDALAWVQANKGDLPKSAPPPPSPSPSESDTSSTWEDWQALTGQALENCQLNLAAAPAVLDYLHKQGYSTESIIARGLGYNPAWQRLKLHKSDGGEVWLPPGVVFPWWKEGELYGLKVRCPYHRDGQGDDLAQVMEMSPQRAKYMQVAGGRIREAWYGEIVPGLPLIFTEGEKDRDNLHQQLEGRAGVITLGSASGHLPDDLFAHLQTVPWVALALDNDEAGYTNTLRLQSALSAELGRRVPVLPAFVPDSEKDISDWLLAGGDALTWFEGLATTAEHRIAMRSWDAESATHFPFGVPDVLREALLSLHHLTPAGKSYIKDHANAAMVYEILQNIVLNKPEIEHFTVSEFNAAAEGLGIRPSDSSIRRGLAQLEALGFLSICTPCFGSHKEESKGVGLENNKRTRGRPSVVYKIQPIATALASFQQHLTRRLREALYRDVLPAEVEAEWFSDILSMEDAEAVAALIAEASEDLVAAQAESIQAVEKQIADRQKEWRDGFNPLTLHLAYSTPLPSDMVYSSGRDFRDAYYAALVQDAGPAGRKIARAKAAAQLGVHSKTMSNIRERVQVVAEPQFETFVIEKGVYDVCLEANLLAPWAADREYGRYLESSSGERIRLRREETAMMTHWVRKQHMLGYVVCLQVQVASRERFASPEELVAYREEQAFFVEMGQLAAEERHYQQTSVPDESLTRPIQETSPAGASSSFVYDQLRLRLTQLLPLLAFADGLKEVLLAYQLVGSGLTRY